MSQPPEPNPQTFHFRNLHPKILIGTASDRYAGWIGQIYSQDRYEGRITRRTRIIGGKSFHGFLPKKMMENNTTI
jgi:hypothetical protein